MLVIFGTMTCGQADVADKRFSVATEFFHIMWFPLFPTASLVVFDQQAPKRILTQLAAAERIQSICPASMPASFAS